jgi:hypothetical protein
MLELSDAIFARIFGVGIPDQREVQYIPEPRVFTSELLYCIPDMIPDTVSYQNQYKICVLSPVKNIIKPVISDKKKAR